MTRTIAAGAALAVLLSSAPSLGQSTMNTLTPQEKAQGWQLLFDGKTMAGWHSSVPPPPSGGRRGASPPAAGVGATPPSGGGRSGGAQPAQRTPGQVGTPKPCVTRSQSATPAGASHWEVVDGTLSACDAPTGYLTSDKSYKNFVLSVEFKTAAETNSGVFVRSPQENGGYEVQIWRQQPAGYNTGSIVNVAKTARDYTFKPDDWNRFQITADGDHIVVELNGEKTLDIRDTRFPEGNVRLQYQQFPIAFRNIKIRPLP
jgi:3-keto-disaccharide hydrolase